MTGSERSRLLLVRHGETGWNAAGRWQGHGGAGLSDLGRKQAQVTAEAIVASFDDVALIVRSDLERVVETSAAFEALLDVPVREDPRLREIDVGSWSGFTHAEIAERDSARYAAWKRGEDVVPGGGERVADLQARVVEALREHAGTLRGGQTAVVVTHGGPVRVGVAGLLGRWVVRLADACEPVGNCALTVVAGPEPFAVERYGDASHLDGLEAAAGEAL